MWESPINIMEIQDSFVSEIKEKTEEMVFTEIKRIGIDVDKEELLKALQYDREQYDKGYSDGYANAVDKFAERICDRVNDDSLQVVLPNGFRADVITIDYVAEIAVEIAEQLKGGAE